MAKYRIFNIMQYEKHPTTDEPLLNEDTIKIALAHKTITRYAYICHDKDNYTKEDEDKNPTHKQGTLKPKHWHIVIETAKNATEIKTIAKWFNIPTNFIDCPKGQGAFLDCVEYLTHEAEKQQELGKHKYDDTEVIANFDFRDELDKRLERKLRYGGDLDIKSRMRLDVLMNGKTLIQCQEENPLLYSADMEKLKKLRLEYIYKQQPPKTRINYYVSGRGGLGKGLCSRALARALFPQITHDDELFFIVGNGNSTFEGYDGQPVIIWDDCRAIDLLTLLGSRGNVFNVLDTHPVKKRQNIKYGSINLCNTVNIINSVQSYVEFLDGLAGEYKGKNGEIVKAEDKGQAYRRIPFIMNLHEEDFDLLVNKGFIENTKNFEEFEVYSNIIGNFQNVRVDFRKREELAKQVENEMLQIPKQKFDEVISRENEEVENVDELLAKYKNYGKTKAQIEVEEFEQLQNDFEEEPRYREFLEYEQAERMKRFRAWEERKEGA